MLLDHVALLTPSLEVSRAALLALFPSLPVLPVHEFPGEGTREFYVGGPDAAARLLLVEPTGAGGPYAKALRERGAGLHHFAFNVPDVTTYVNELAGTGWYLLPQSLVTIAKARTAWLARPGVPALVEVHGALTKSGLPVVESLEIPLPPRQIGLLERLSPRGMPLEGLFGSAHGEKVKLRIEGRWIVAADLLKLE